MSLKGHAWADPWAVLKAVATAAWTAERMVATTDMIQAVYLVGYLVGQRAAA